MIELLIGIVLGITIKFFIDEVIIGAKK